MDQFLRTITSDFDLFDLRAFEHQVGLKLRERERRGDSSPLPTVVTVPIKRIKILDRLQSMKGFPRIYWKGRGSDFEFGGWGESFSLIEGSPARFSQTIDFLSGMLRTQSADKFLRFFGGLAFSPDQQTDALWEEFPKFWFMIPEFAFARQGAEHFFIAFVSERECSSQQEMTSTLLEKITTNMILERSAETDSLPEMVSRRDIPDQPGWQRIVESALEEIARGQLQKVVLARRTDLQFRHPLDPVIFLNRLQKANPECYTILIQPNRSSAFVSATPERLFHTDGSRLLSEALSGTIARGSGPEEEALNSEALLASSKDAREQKYVVDDLMGRFDQLCEDVKVSERPQIMKLSNVQHLRSEISGVLKPGSTLGKTMTTLHPTPAVGGVPSQAALDLISHLEESDRGWYAAPVGLISANEADMAVAIRSALIRGSEVSLFSGAGIVSGSGPASEWNELDDKISTALKILAGA